MIGYLIIKLYLITYEISQERKSMGLNVNILADRIDDLERDLINLSGVFHNTTRNYFFENIKINLLENEIYVDFLNNYGDSYYVYN